MLKYNPLVLWHVQMGLQCSLKFYFVVKVLAQTVGFSGKEEEPPKVLAILPGVRSFCVAVIIIVFCLKAL